MSNRQISIERQLDRCAFSLDSVKDAFCRLVSQEFFDIRINERGITDVLRHIQSAPDKFPDVLHSPLAKGCSIWISTIACRMKRLALARLTLANAFSRSDPIEV
jgi:hypothetical protein